MAHGHPQVSGCNGQTEGQQVDQYLRTDATPVYALHGKTVPRGHRQRPTGPQPVYWLDRPRGLLSLESSPARPDSSRPPPPRAADA